MLFTNIARLAYIYWFPRMYEEFMGRLCFVCDLETICERYSAVGHLAAQIAIQALGCGADLGLYSQSSRQPRLRGLSVWKEQQAVQVRCLIGCFTLCWLT